MRLSGEVLRAARAMARLEQLQLAQAAGVSLETIKRLERIRGPINANRRTVTALQGALLQAGVAMEPRSGGGLALLWGGSGGAPARTDLAERSETEDLHRLIYYSTARDPAPADAAAVCDQILRVSAPRNDALGVGGCLAACDGRFLQALEGGRRAVLEIYGSIAADPRHQDLVVIESRAISARRFPGWVMCARASTREELALADPSQADGFRPERLSPAAGLGVLAWVADLEARALAAGLADAPPPQP